MEESIRLVLQKLTENLELLIVTHENYKTRSNTVFDFP